MTAEKLTVCDLQVAVRRSGQELVRGVSFDVEPGSSFGFVGEISSGRSLTCRAVISLLPAGLRSMGDIFHGGTCLSGLSSREQAGVRGRTISMILQDPLAALNRMMQAVLISPHSASTVASENERIIELFLHNFRRFTRGEPLINVYEGACGY